VRREAPDYVVVATGSVPQPAWIEGSEEMATLEASEVLRGKAQTGADVVLVDERGDWMGMGVAEQIVRAGCRVRLCTIGDFAGQSIEAMTRYRWLGILHNLGVEIMPNLRIAGISGSTVYFQHAASLQPVMLDGADTVVLARHYRASTELEGALRESGVEVEAIGDCRAPRTAEEAVYEGMMAGLVE
jgi:NADPH-dependent 2,4-dienoyl-CoA reductase/sulfur reductase-like enzyme